MYAGFFKILVIALGFCIVPLVKCASSGPASKPNILLIVLDDFGYNDLAVNNSSDSPTPTLDELANNGIRFTRHYAESSCTVSRVALLTGLYPAKVGSHPNINGIDHDLVTLADFLQGDGYKTHMIGKWHTGDAHIESGPEYQGFDEWFGFISQLYLRGPDKLGNYQAGAPRYIDPWLEDHHGTFTKYPGHLTDLLTDKAISTIARQDSPWFIQLSYYAPHSPVTPAERFAEQFPATKAGAFQALKAQLDYNIGRVMHQLKVSGSLKNTIVVIVSDNGGTERAWPSNYPFTGVKAKYQEGGVRTPLILSWPGHWHGGRVINDPVMIIDIFPTLAAALNTPPPKGLDGRDIFGPQSPRTLKWYSHGVWGDSYGSLSPDGNWRLKVFMDSKIELVHENHFTDQQPKNQSEELPQRTIEMRNAMQAWTKNATRINDLSITREGLWTEYRGSDFRRTPLGTPLTAGFVFHQGKEGLPSGEESLATKVTPQVLVNQDGYFNISEFNGTFTVEIDGNKVEFQPPKEQACFTLTIVNYPRKNNMVFYRKDSSSQTRVFLDGVLKHSALYKNPVLSKASPKNPLQVYNSTEGRWYMPYGQDLYLSTRAIRPLEVANEVHPLLNVACTEGSSG